MIWSQDSFIKAWNFATQAHLGQKLPSSELPYINHIGNVAMEIMSAIAMEPVNSPDLAVQCALLHDVIEDTPITYEQIKTEFGANVADGVMALTKNNTLAKEDRMRDSLNRILNQSKEIWMVKLADRITNLQPPPSHWTKAKIESYRIEAMEIYSTLKLAHPILSARLLEKIEHYEAYVDR